MKYIIDLPDNCSWVQWVMTSDKDGHAFFDFKQPRDLTPLDNELEEAYQKGYEVGQHETTTLEYQQGLNDAWETITKIAKMPDGEKGKVFGETWISNILNGNSLAEITEKLKVHEQQKVDAEINVGDEVRSEVTGSIGTVMKPSVCGDPDYIYLLYEDGSMGKYRKSEYRKTGRHFHYVEKLLNEMRGDED